MHKNVGKRLKIIIALCAFIGLVVSNILLFAFLYDKYNCLADTNIPQQQKFTRVSFGDDLYFSGISYLTIGYGDFKPVNPVGKILSIIQGLTAVLINSLFTGLFVFYFLKRPRNILITEKIYIRYSEERDTYFLCLRIGNKGHDLIEVNRILELFVYAEEIRKRKVHLSKPYYYIEKLLYLDIDLKDDSNKELLDYIKRGIFDNEDISIRVTLKGTDSETGELAFVSKYYSQKDILFIKDYELIYKWKNHARTEFNWDNFNKIVPLESEKVEEFKTL